MAELLPHVAKALDLGIPMRQLTRQNQRLLSAIDRLSIGIRILDRKGNIVLKNAELQRKIESHRVFSVSPTGVLKINDADAQKRFEA